MDYTIWYREQNKEDEAAAGYSTVVTCYLTVHVNFLGRRINWLLVK